MFPNDLIVHVCGTIKTCLGCTSHIIYSYYKQLNFIYCMIIMETILVIVLQQVTCVLMWTSQSVWAGSVLRTERLSSVSVSITSSLMGSPVWVSMASDYFCGHWQSCVRPHIICVDE